MLLQPTAYGPGGSGSTTASESARAVAEATAKPSIAGKASARTRAKNRVMCIPVGAAETYDLAPRAGFPAPPSRSRSAAAAGSLPSSPTRLELRVGQCQHGFAAARNRLRQRRSL